MTDPSTTRLERTLRPALAVLAVAAVCVFAVMVVLRIGYPFELEWMEGAMVDEAVRVRDGLPTYGPPAAAHVPFLYTPLFYWVSALAMSVCGEGFVAVRLVSVAATAACLWLIYDLVRRMDGRRSTGLIAAGLFAAGYGWLRSWYDLGRNDMVFLAAMLAVIRVLHDPRRFAPEVAGAAAAVAFLGKQTALLWLPALAVAASLVDWRRGARFTMTAAVAIGLTALVGHVVTDGWFSFYVFTMPRAHGVQPDRWVGFFTEDLVPILPLLAIVGIVAAARWGPARWGPARWGPDRRAALATLAYCGGGLLASYLSRLHAGGFDNVLMYGFAAACVTGVGGLASLSSRARAVALALLAVQFVTLVVDVRALAQTRPPLLYRPGKWVPTATHRRASDQLLQFVGEQQGPVLLPFHGHLTVMAGKPACAHGQALGDLMTHVLKGPPDDRAALALQADFERTLGQQLFAAVVLERPFGPVFEGMFAPYLGGYQRLGRPLIDDPMAIRPLVGMVNEAPYALVPRR